MADNGINVLIITQASSESSICVAVPENQGEAALAALQRVFELELARSAINSVGRVHLSRAGNTLDWDRIGSRTASRAPRV